jgi:hypothetical protein
MGFFCVVFGSDLKAYWWIFTIVLNFFSRKMLQGRLFIEFQVTIKVHWFLLAVHLFLLAVQLFLLACLRAPSLTGGGYTGDSILKKMFVSLVKVWFKISLRRRYGNITRVSEFSTRNAFRSYDLVSNSQGI